MRLKRSLAALTPLLSLGVLLAGVNSLAQTPEPTPLPDIELERLTLNPSGTGSLVLGTGELLRKGDLRLSLTGHYEHDPLVSFSQGQFEGSVVEHRVTSHLAGAYGITNWLEVSAQVPVLLMQRGDALSGLERPAEGLALGTPYVGVRLGLLSQQADGSGLDLAVGLNTGLPLGSAEALTRDARLRYLPNLMVGRNLGPVRAAVDLGLLLRRTTPIPTTPTTTTATEVGDALRLGAALSTTGKGLRGELDILTHVPLHNEPLSMEALAGARLPLSKSFEAYALAGVGFGRAPGTPDFRGLLGVAYKRPGKSSPPPPCMVPGKGPDGDCDEVADSEDKCPTVPGLKEYEGCPAPLDPTPTPPLDTDKDGIKNSEDKCPLLPGLKEFQGCPDSDKDGIQDLEDKCPSLAGVKEFQGCPDSDKDGVQDLEDKCPSVPGERKFQGCPDSDKDTVPDHDDQCPFKEGLVENRGCPKEYDPTRYQTRPVYFVFRRAEIEGKQSFEVLDTLAAHLHAHPEIVKLRIEGHTDDRGTADFNLKLSQARAEAVLEYLVKIRGVSRERLVAEGFGEGKPIAGNKTEEGRALNRRVDFILQFRNDKQR